MKIAMAMHLDVEQITDCCLCCTADFFRIQANLPKHQVFIQFFSTGTDLKSEHVGDSDFIRQCLQLIAYRCHQVGCHLQRV
jgi:hypothetical protein